MVHEVADVAPGAGAPGAHAQLHAAGVGPLVEPGVRVDADPLAGVLLDVHGLDERLHEAEQVGDSHRCAETTVGRAIPARFGEDLGWDLGERGRSGGRGG